MTQSNSQILVAEYDHNRIPAIVSMTVLGILGAAA